MIKKIFLGIGIFSIALMSTYDKTSAQKYSLYKAVSEEKIQVTASKLNVRSGAGKEFTIIGNVKKGQILDVIGGLGEWYVVHLPDDSIGVVSNQYVKAYKMGTKSNSAGDSYDLEAVFAENKASDIKTLEDLINSEREKYKLPKFTFDEKINEIAELKANDMSTNHYLSHDSEKYGTPFEMLKQFGVLYKNASENIAGNKSVTSAHNQFMGSMSHRVNILNPNFNKMGIGIVNDAKYGKVIVEMFVEQ